jgi:hypothetical protein
VCDNCEANTTYPSKRHSGVVHKHSHPLVRHHPNSMALQDSLPPTPVITPVKVPKTHDLPHSDAEEPAMALDGAALLEQLSALESRQSKVEARLISMEDMLNRIVVKLDA